jgi:hypothetical protein
MSNEKPAEVAAQRASAQTLKEARELCVVALKRFYELDMLVRGHMYGTSENEMSQWTRDNLSKLLDLLHKDVKGLEAILKG